MGSFQVDSKQVCETILEELPVGVVVLSTDGTIHHANAFVERLFGYSPGGDRRKSVLHAVWD